MTVTGKVTAVSSQNPSACAEGKIQWKFSRLTVTVTGKVTDVNAQSPYFSGEECDWNSDLDYNGYSQAGWEQPSDINTQTVGVTYTGYIYNSDPSVEREYVCEYPNAVASEADLPDR